MSACLFLRDRLNLRWVLGGLLLWVAVGGFGMNSEARAQAPVVSSFTPAEGATDITIDTPIVITFDRDMDTTVAVLSSLNLTMSPAEKRAQIDRIKAMQNQIAMRISAQLQ